MLPGAGDRRVIAGIGVTHDADCWIVQQNAIDRRAVGRPIAADDRAGVLREAHANLATVM